MRGLARGALELAIVAGQQAEGPAETAAEVGHVCETQRVGDVGNAQVDFQRVSQGAATLLQAPRLQEPPYRRPVVAQDCVGIPKPDPH